MKYLRAPFMVFGVVFGGLGVAFAVASVTVGDWAERALRLLGYKGRPTWLPALIGVGGYLSLGVAAPAWGGFRLIGWPGALIAPMLVLLLMALVDQW